MVEKKFNKIFNNNNYELIDLKKNYGKGYAVKEGNRKN